MAVIMILRERMSLKCHHNYAPFLALELELKVLGYINAVIQYVYDNFVIININRELPLLERYENIINIIISIYSCPLPSIALQCRIVA